MVSFSFLLLISISTVVGVLGAPQRSKLSLRQALTTSPSSGINNGYYYYFWREGNPQLQEEVTLGPGGSYSVTWSDNDDQFFIGKGWNPGSAQTINYTGSFAPESGTAYLSVYGWTTSPLVEYYIVESYGNFNPSSDDSYAYKGNVTSDGGTYDIYLHIPPNEGMIPGPELKQYWSVRTKRRVGGTVTTANHFDAWSAAGMDLGTFNYQILSTEGNNSSGFASITVF